MLLFGGPWPPNPLDLPLLAMSKALFTLDRNSTERKETDQNCSINKGILVGFQT